LAQPAAILAATAGRRPVTEPGSPDAFGNLVRQHRRSRPRPGHLVGTGDAAFRSAPLVAMPARWWPAPDLQRRSSPAPACPEVIEGRAADACATVSPACRPHERSRRKPVERAMLTDANLGERSRRPNEGASADPAVEQVLELTARRRAWPARRWASAPDASMSNPEARMPQARSCRLQSSRRVLRGPPEQARWTAV
jgi:hypothetical protein